MGKYTAWDNPIVDQTIENHMEQIVAAVRSGIEPEAIVLRGSFSRGEGSVVIEDGNLHFLSDYELMAVTPRYQDRQWLETVANQITTQTGVETSIARLQPSKGSEGSSVQKTIVMYELQHSGLTLYGQSWVSKAFPIDPCTLETWSAIRMLLNRMAESLCYVSPTKDWNGLKWISKTALACAEALLLVSGEYHFSYAERGRRFARLVSQLDGVLTRAKDLPELVSQATAFKLRPSLDCYPEDINLVWRQTKDACDATFRYLINKYLGFTFDSYAGFPELYKRYLISENKMRQGFFSPLPARPSQNAYLFLRQLRNHRRLPLRLVGCGTYPAHQIVYSVVPLAFLGSDGKTLNEARRWLGKVTHLEPRHADEQAEWQYLRARTVQAWKDYCYGLWERI